MEKRVVGKRAMEELVRLLLWIAVFALVSIGVYMFLRKITNM
jgi:hypothetical protein